MRVDTDARSFQRRNDSFFQYDMVDVGLLKSVGCRQTSHSTTNNNDAKRLLCLVAHLGFGRILSVGPQGLRNPSLQASFRFPIARKLPSCM